MNSEKHGFAISRKTTVTYTFVKIESNSVMMFVLPFGGEIQSEVLDGRKTFIHS